MTPGPGGASAPDARETAGGDGAMCPVHLALWRGWTTYQTVPPIRLIVIGKGLPAKERADEHYKLVNDHLAHIKRCCRDNRHCGDSATPDEWERMLGSHVVDRDTWEGEEGCWDAPTTLAEYERRAARCVIDRRRRLGPGR